MHLYVDGFGFLAMVVFEAWAVMGMGLSVGGVVDGWIFCSHWDCYW